ncbi:MAG: DegT/DnrJ/EryC1/StrS aminotransferase family protein [Gammaproteobacteria bacterium]|nr:DegT/DnrJ/EryC1/StrS aminotransferase family protein [Gammaproteobacteria bacterium]
MSDELPLKDFLPFARPLIGDAEINEIVACLKSGWLATGPRTEKFEQDLQNYLHAPHALTTTNGTAALHLALLAFNFNPGDEVITTPMTFAATINAIILAGAKPVLVDIDPTTYNIDVTKIETALSANTRAIVPVHFAGLPVDLDPIYALAKRHQLRILEDAAHAIGSEYKGKKIGEFGDTQMFSFYANKDITTGEGGCVTTHDDATAKQITINRFHGIDRTAWNRFGKSGNQHYDVVNAGFKYNMSDLQAALGIHQLAALDGFIAERTTQAKRYYELLDGRSSWTLPQQPNYTHRHAWHLFAPLINPGAAGIDRDQFINAMKEKNIGIGLHYQAVHLYSYYREQFGYQRGDFPHAETVGERIVSLPLFPGLTADMQRHIVATMKQVCQ